MSETTKTKSASKTSKTSKKEETKVEVAAPVAEQVKETKSTKTSKKTVVEEAPVVVTPAKETKSTKAAKTEKAPVEDAKVEAPAKDAKSSKKSVKKSTKKDAKSASKGKGKAKKEEVEEEDDPRKRYFHCVYKNKDGEVVRAGRYSGKKPKQAARKALSRVVDKNEVKLGEKITFLIKECTRGRKKKAYSYEGSRVELEEPVVVEIKKKEGGTAKLTYKHDNVVKKVALTECADLLNVDFNDQVAEEQPEEVKVKKVEKGGSKKVAEKTEKAEKVEKVEKVEKKVAEKKVSAKKASTKKSKTN